MNVFVIKFLNRIAKNIYWFFETKIPHNSQYKPTGIYQTSEAHLSASGLHSLKCIKVLDGYTARLQVSPEFRDVLRKYMHGFVDREVNVPDKKVVEVANGRIYSNHEYAVSVISADNKLIKDISLDLRAGADHQLHIFKRKYFVKPVKFNGVVFSLLTGGGGIDNYFHWLYDSLSRLHFLKKAQLYEKVDWFLVPSTKYRFQRESLRLLNIPESKIIRGDLFPHILADAIIATSGVRDGGLIPEWICEFLRENFLKHKDTNKKYPPLVYISRGDAIIRNIANETELIKLASQFGFEVFQLGKLQFDEQIALFASAAFIISPHGAGLANLAFCKPGTVVIELFSEGWINGGYPHICSTNGLIHEYLIGKPDALTINKKHLQQSNYIIDLHSLEFLLNKHLEKRET